MSLRSLLAPMNIDERYEEMSISEILGEAWQIIDDSMELVEETKQ